MPAAATSKCAGFPGDVYHSFTDSFLDCWLRSLDEHNIHYCALKIWSDSIRCPEFAIDPADHFKLALVFNDLRQSGFIAVKCNKSARAQFTVWFSRLNDAEIENASVVLVFGSIAGVPLALTASRLVERRVRREGLWVVSPVDELAILLPGIVDGEERDQERLVIRLQTLIRSATERDLKALFGDEVGHKFYVRRTILNVADVVAEVHRCSRKRQNPDVIESIATWLESHFRPGGLFIIFLGPDGVGKTTLLRRMATALTTVFPQQRFQRWRPAKFSSGPRPVLMPHSKPLRGMWGSIGYLLFALLDFVTGYLFSRKFLQQGGLAIFDRYYHDLLIDPKRYRYTGPMWFARLVSHFIPPRDAFFVVLDADEAVILSRKQQLTLSELSRQRKAYCTFALQRKSSVLICTEETLDACVARGLSGALAHLSLRLQRQYPHWFQAVLNICE